jgi:hypothetical protein
MSKVNKNSGGLGNSPSILDSKSSGGFKFSGGAGGSCNSCINHTFNEFQNTLSPIKKRSAK